MSKTKICKFCKEEGHTQFHCRQKPRKPIKPVGKRGNELRNWVDTVARPYLLKTYGPVCAACAGARCGNRQLDVDHIKNKGSHYHLRMSLDNVQLLGRFPCHREKTDNVNKKVDI